MKQETLKIFACENVMVYDEVSCVMSKITSCIIPAYAKYFGFVVFNPAMTWSPCMARSPELVFNLSTIKGQVA